VCLAEGGGHAQLCTEFLELRDWLRPVLRLGPVHEDGGDRLVSIWIDAAAAPLGEMREMMRTGLMRKI
jgi:hypothetical protein